MGVRSKMAVGSTVLIKRTTSTSTLPTLRYGEIAVAISTGAYNNYGGRLWIGDDAQNPIVVGGRYFTELLDHQPGVLTPGSAIITNSSNEIDTLTVTGNLNVSGNVINTSGINTFTFGITAGSIGIASNTISTKSGSGNIMYLDPYPDGLSSEGTVIIKGNLQVDGSTTTINSSTVTVEESILALSDPSSVRTITSNVSAGASVLTLDSVSGINTGDVLRNLDGLPATDALRKVISYNIGSKTVSIAGTVTSAITSQSQVTVVYGWDTQTNRGVSFTYNDDSVGLGTTATKTGFFGFQDYNKRFTYIPDATIGVTTSTGIRGYVSGTKGYLDIKGIYYQLADTSTNGVVYFDNTGLMNSSTSPGSGISTSNYILTTQPGTNVPVWTSTIDGGEY